MNGKYINYIPACAVLLLFIGFAAMHSLNKPKMMVLHSYNRDYCWTEDVDEGIRRVFEEYPDYRIRWHYMDTKKCKESSPDCKKRAGTVAEQAIERWEPAVLIAVDNDAQAYVAKNFAVFDRKVEKPVLIVFAGINGPIEKYGYEKARNVTGIRENRACEGMKEMILASEWRKMPRYWGEGPGRGIRVNYITDSSGSVNGDKEYIKSQFSTWPFSYKYIGKADDEIMGFEDWKKAVGRIDPVETDYLLVTNYRKLRTPPITGAWVRKWTEENAPVPVVFSPGEGAMEISDAVGKPVEGSGGTTARLAGLVPDAETVIRLCFLYGAEGDGDETGASLTEELKKRFTGPSYRLDVKGVRNFPEWKRSVLRAGKRYDCLVVNEYPGFQPVSPFVPPGEVMSWTVEHSPVPVMGLNFFNAKDGCMQCVGASPFEQGEVAARMAIEILWNKRFVHEQLSSGVDYKLTDYIPIKDNKQFIVGVREPATKNQERQKIELPKVFETFSRATENYYGND